MDDNFDSARAAGDRLRVTLLVVALAGMTASYFVRRDCSTWLAGATLFSIAVLCCLVSLFTLKARELARTRARSQGLPAPEITMWDWRASWTWDSLAFALIACGVAMLLLGFLNVT